MFKINTEQFAILSEQLPTGEVVLLTNLNFRYAIEINSISVAMNFTFECDKTKFLILAISCEFEILKKDWDSFNKDGKITIPKNLLEIFTVHTLGTARGIMYCKTDGTIFNTIIIPPLNVANMIKGDLVIKI